jgi:hypothetical protein
MSNNMPSGGGNEESLVGLRIIHTFAHTGCVEVSRNTGTGSLPEEDERAGGETATGTNSPAELGVHSEGCGCCGYNGKVGDRRAPMGTGEDARDDALPERTSGSDAEGACKGIAGVRTAAVVQIGVSIHEEGMEQAKRWPERLHHGV